MQMQSVAFAVCLGSVKFESKTRTVCKLKQQQQQQAVLQGLNCSTGRSDIHGPSELQMEMEIISRLMFPANSMQYCSMMLTHSV